MHVTRVPTPWQIFDQEAERIALIVLDSDGFDSPSSTKTSTDHELVCPRELATMSIIQILPQNGLGYGYVS